MVLSMQCGDLIHRADVFLAVAELVWYSFLITRKLTGPLRAAANAAAGQFEKR